MAGSDRGWFSKKFFPTEDEKLEAKAKRHAEVEARAERDAQFVELAVMGFKELRKFKDSERARKLEREQPRLPQPTEARFIEAFMSEHDMPSWFARPVAPVLYGYLESTDGFPKPDEGVRSIPRGHPLMEFVRVVYKEAEKYPALGTGSYPGPSIANLLDGKDVVRRLMVCDPVLGAPYASAVRELEAVQFTVGLPDED